MDALKRYGAPSATLASLLALVVLMPAGADEGEGRTVYQTTCIACHGANGRGAFPGTPNFSDPDGPLAKSDEELIRNITEGFKSPGSAMAMPPKGGNPGLTDAEVAAVLAYLRAEFGAQ